MTRSVGKVDNICRKYSYKIYKSHGATYMLIGASFINFQGEHFIRASHRFLGRLLLDTLKTFQTVCLALHLLLFTLQQTLAAADTNRAAAADEEDGEDGEGSLESVAAFSKTEVQEDRKALLCLSCREQKWKKEDTEDMEHCQWQRDSL